MLKEHFYIYVFILVAFFFIKFISYSTIIAVAFPMFLPAINVLAPAETPKLCKLCVQV
jgi:hypothetical protein